VSDAPQTDPPNPELPNPEADRLVARGFWRSFAVIAFIAAAIVGFRLLRAPQPKPAGSGAPVTPPAESPADAVRVAGVAFRDVTAEAGVDFTHESGARGAKLLPECLGGGVAVVDLDGDGALDLVFTQGQPLEPAAGDPAAGRGGIRVFLNRGGASGALRFERLAGDEALAAGSYAFGVAAGDLDGDARPDLFVSCLGQDRLFLNKPGEGAPRLVEAAVPPESQWGTSAGMFDADADGDLDVVVANYVVWSPEIDRAVNFTLDGIGRAYGPPTGFEGTSIALLLNDRGALRDATAASGVSIRNPVTGVLYAKALGLAFLDADRDGRTDILVANDKTPKFLLRNEGPAADGTPRFRDIAVETGFAYDRDGNATGAMGIDFAWLRGGSELAVAVGNFANEQSSLYVDARAKGAPAFSDDASGEGVGAPTRRSLTFGTLFLDVDLDGDDDLLQANGHLEPEIARIQPSQAYAQRAQLLMNRGGDGRPLFVEAPAAELGDLATPAVGRALAAGDLDGDGDDDLVLVDLAGKARILRNDQATGHGWIAVDGPLGTEVEIVTTTAAGPLAQRRAITSTRSYLSQCEPVARFGLGAAKAADAVRARFPDGSTREWTNIAANRRFSLLKPE